MTMRVQFLAILMLTCSIGNHVAAQNARGTLELSIVDEVTRQPAAGRVHLKNADGKPQRHPTLPYWFDHFTCPGSARLELPPGKYTYEVERGPEYERVVGSVNVVAEQTAKFIAGPKRLVDMQTEGWWPGELHIHRPPAEIELLMRSENLHVGPVITWWNNRNLWEKQALPASPVKTFDENRYSDLLAGEDEREGGTLLYFHRQKPLSIAGSTREFPSPLQFVAEARQQPGVWIDIEKPFWWDMPTWVASGQADSIGIANNHMCRDRMLENEAWGKPRVVERMPAPRGNGFWTQEIYYHLLNCGIRLPPSAGSASGVLPNPVGYNRVYVHIGQEFKYESWWRNLRAGQSLVTNGPLLRVRAGGALPGHVFTGPSDRGIELEITGKLTTRDRIRVIEIVRNGQIERKVPVDQFESSGSLGKIGFTSSGWFLVRAIADEPKTFRFASTAPFYVEIGDTKHRVSKASAQFFCDWVSDRMGRIKLADAKQRAAVLKHHENAKIFWQERVEQANAP